MANSRAAGAAKNIVIDNPLRGHFRQAAVYLRLPSSGDYWPLGSLEIPPDGQIPIYPMTVQNEITLKMPDALLTGAAVVEVIESCCPCIKDAWKMPNVDVDTILMGIRIASYGENMEVSSICPSCKTESNYDIPLYNVINSVKVPDYNQSYQLGELTFVFKPQNYQSLSELNLANFSEARVSQAFQDDTMSDDQKTKIAEEHLKRLVELNLSVLAGSTHSITTPEDVEVTDPKMLMDFYRNADMNTVKQVQEIVSDLAKQGKTPDQKIQCMECGHHYETPIEFDYSTFFG
jgi:hypothetical protein